MCQGPRASLIRPWASQVYGCLLLTRKRRSVDTLSPSCNSHTAVVLLMNIDFPFCVTSTKRQCLVLKALPLPSESILSSAKTEMFISLLKSRLNDDLCTAMRRSLRSFSMISLLTISVISEAILPVRCVYFLQKLRNALVAHWFFVI